MPSENESKTTLIRPPLQYDDFGFDDDLEPQQPMRDEKTFMQDALEAGMMRFEEDEHEATEFKTQVKENHSEKESEPQKDVATPKLELSSPRLPSKKFLPPEYTGVDKETQTLAQICRELMTNRPNVESYLAYMLSRRRLRIALNPRTEESFTDIQELANGQTSYVIQLGTEPISTLITQKITFLDRRFSSSELIQYRLLHEISHTWMNELLIQLNKVGKILMNVCKTEHAQDGLFFTALASYKFSPNPSGSYELPENTGTVPIYEEDAVELLCMNLWSDSYFDSYMRYLSDPEYKPEHKKLHLRSLSSEHAGALKSLVQEVSALTEVIKTKQG